jgi:hypothetical protein
MSELQQLEKTGNVDDELTVLRRVWDKARERRGV